MENELTSISASTAGMRERKALRRRFDEVRTLSQQLAAPLSPEDQCVQSMPDASPTKWHLAHTTWFFETVVLRPHSRGYQVFDERFHFLFNSYYESLGPRHPRPQRGLLTRPSLHDVMRYRAHVNEALADFLEHGSDESIEASAALITLGLHHEQQHQELMLTDLKHLLSLNPLQPVYVDAPAASSRELAPMQWVDRPGGHAEVGHSGGEFSFDNETPRHEVLLRPHQLASRPVTNGEYLAFVRDGGYSRPELWLSDGWAAVQSQGLRAPLYWSEAEDGEWSVFTLMGPRPLSLAEPACHLSLYEAAAYAQWAGARLPTEFEWEAAAQALGRPAARFDRHYPHPVAAGAEAGLQQMFGEVWEWTRSSYDPYPGFKPLAGSVGEYNGKFMVSQVVLRGGSCATPSGHLRASYRNFFPPGARWQFSGLRLARDA